MWGLRDAYLAGRSRNGAQLRRLLVVAIVMVMDGRPRAEAAACNRMDRQTPSDWMHRYNEEGPKA